MVGPQDMKSALGWALAASLGVNLFLGGFVVSRSLSQSRGNDLPQLVDVVMPRGVPQGLPVEVREELEDQVRSRRQELRDVYREYGRTQKEIGRLLAAEEFDSEALQREYEQLRELGAQMQGPIHDAVIAAAQGMDAANRRMIIQLQQMENGKIRFATPERLDGRRWKFERGGQGFEFSLNTEDEDNDERHDLQIFITDEEPEEPEEDGEEFR